MKTPFFCYIILLFLSLLPFTFYLLPVTIYQLPRTIYQLPTYPLYKLKQEKGLKEKSAAKTRGLSVIRDGCGLVLQSRIKPTLGAGIIPGLGPNPDNNSRRFKVRYTSQVCNCINFDLHALNLLLHIMLSAEPSSTKPDNFAMISRILTNG